MRPRALVGPAALLALWTAAWAIGWPGPRVVPGPHEVVLAAAAALGGAEAWLDLGATLGRVLAGVGLATAAGAVLGVGLGCARRRWRAAEPTLDFLRSIPPILSFPLFLLGLGYGDRARVAAIAFGSVGLVALHVGQALDRAPAERRETVQLLGLRGGDALLHLYVYEALPALLLGLRLALATGLVIAIVTEMLIGAPHGLGVRALDAQLSNRADVLWVVLLLSGAVGAALSTAVRALERRVVWWATPSR